MGSSSGSPVTSDEIYQCMERMPRYLARRPSPSCKHGDMVVRTSRTNSNPGRRFYSCRRSGSIEACESYSANWIDDPLTDHYRGYIVEVTNERNLAREQLQNALLKQEINSNQVQPLRNERNEAVQRIAELEKNIEDMDCELMVLQEKIGCLEATLEGQKKKD